MQEYGGSLIMCMKNTEEGHLNEEEELPPDTKYFNNSNFEESTDKLFYDGDQEIKGEDDHLTSCNESVSDCDNLEQMELSELEELLDAGN